MTNRLSQIITPRSLLHAGPAQTTCVNPGVSLVPDDKSTQPGGHHMAAGMGIQRLQPRAKGQTAR